MTKTIRPSKWASPVNKTILATIRILIASYFVATATGLVFDPSARVFFDAVLPSVPAQFATTVFLYGTAFALMVGFATRLAGLLLALYVFWSAYIEFALGGSHALSLFWRDMVLICAIVLITLTHSQGQDLSFKRRGRRILPRRVALERKHRMDQRRARPANDDTLAAEAQRFSSENELLNIFAEDWAAGPQKP